MAWYKGTQQQANSYNDEVSEAQNYKGETQKYSPVIEIGGSFYVYKHPEFSSNMQEVEKLPQTEEI